MDDREYFTVQETSLTIPRSGALAIFAGDKPRKNADGLTSYSLRGPMLLMPQEMWEDAEDTMQGVAKVLNENAHLFFDSAPKPAALEAPDAGVAELVEAAKRLKGIVEEIQGAMEHGTWRDEKGQRLKDTPEWVTFYNALALIAHNATEG